MAVTWATALGWRLRRHLLDPVGEGSVVDVVRQLGAVPAWPDATAELAVAARRGGRVGEAAEALAAGALVKAFTFRGGMHLMTPEDAGAYLAVRASGRMWERASWRTFYELEPSDWPAFRAWVRDAVAEHPLTVAELAAALRRSRRYRRVGEAIAEGHETVLKPLTWQGDVGLASDADGALTLIRLEDVPGWAGLPDLDEAGPTVVIAYLRTHGPAAPERVHEWVGQGLGARRRDVTRWLEALDDRLERLAIEGDEVLVLHDDAAQLRSTRPSTAVRLLPARDPWVMGPGTSDRRVVPPARRQAVSQSANLVVHGGAVAGTWKVRDDHLDLAWFDECATAPDAEIAGAVDALSRSLDRPLELSLTRS
ncbi:MAG: DNA glycosylase AlkZ-like family protein [Angustibacter sp.]